MRKGLFVGALALLVAAAGGGAFWVKSKIEADTKAMLSSLAPADGKVSHGPVSASLWNRTLSVEAIKVVTEGANGLTVDIGRLDFEGIPLSGQGAVPRAVAQDVTVTVTDTTDRAAAPTVKAGRVVLSDVAYVAPSAKSVPADPILRAIAGFVGLKAKSIEAPSMTVSIAMPVAAGKGAGSGATTRIDYTYQDVRLEGVDDGRVARVSAAKGIIRGGAGLPILSGSVEAMEATEIDLLPILGSGLDRRKANGKLFKVQGKSSIGSYTLKMADGGEFSAGHMSGDGFWLDPAKVSFAQMQLLTKQAEAFQTSNPTPRQTAEFLTALIDLYEGIRLDSAVVDEVKIKPPAGGGDVKLSRLALIGLEGGKLGQMRLEGVVATMPGKRGPEPLNVGLFALDKLDLAGMMKLGEAVAKNPMLKPDDLSGQILSLLEGVELNGLDFTDPTSGQAVRIEKYRMSWGSFINGLPSEARFALRAQVPLGPGDPQAALLVQNGVRSLDLDVNSAIRYDRASKQLLTEPFSFSGLPFGSLSGRMVLGNVPQEIFTTNPAVAQAAAMAIEFSELDIALTDGGAIALARKIAGPQFADQILAPLRQPAAPGLNPPLAEPLLASLSQFLSEPGQTLSLRVRPKGPTSLSDIAVQMMVGGPFAFTEAVEVTATVKR